MAISFVSAFEANATSVSLGTTAQAGDLIFLSALQTGSAVTLPSGYTQIDSASQSLGGGTTAYSAIGYKIAAGGETTTGTASAPYLSGAVYRGTGGVGANAKTTIASGSSCGVPGLTLQNTGGTSWAAVVAQCATGTVTISASVTTRSSGASLNFIKHGDTAAGVSSYSGGTASSTGSSAWFNYSVELKPPTTVVSGAGASAGVGSASGIGQTIKTGAGASAGAAAASATGAGLVFATGTGAGLSAGSAAVSGASLAIFSAAGIAAGASVVTGANVQTVSAVGVAAGVATATGKNYQPSRIIVGRLPSGAFGMRVSVPGYNASLDPVDDQKLIFSSEWPDVMPIYQRGSFVHRSTTASGQTPGYSVVQEIDYTTLGYVPFCDFTVRGNGDALPAGSDSYPSDQFYPYTALELPYWDGSGTVTTAGDANAYLRLNVTANKICARSFVRFLTGTTTQGLPRTWTIYYTIYRKQAS